MTFTLYSILTFNYLSRHSLYIDHNGITGKGLITISKSLTKQFSLKYIALWGNKWDVPACEVRPPHFKPHSPILKKTPQAFATLLGGPVSGTSYGDDLSATPVSPGLLFPVDDKRPLYVRAAVREEGGGRGKGFTAPRLGRKDTDIVFYEVEGVLNVAHRV